MRYLKGDKANYKEVKFKILNLWEKIANLWENLVLQRPLRKRTVLRSVWRNKSRHWTSSIHCMANMQILKTSIISQSSTSSWHKRKIPILTHKHKIQSVWKNITNHWIESILFQRLRKSINCTRKSQGFFSLESSRFWTNVTIGKDC